MSFATITAAQRVAVRDVALQVQAVTQPFAQNARPPTTYETAKITPVLDKAAAALAVAGASGIPSTSAIVANGATVSVRNSAGVAAHSGTAVVTTGTLTGINLPATTAMVDASAVVTVKNSAGTTVTGSHTATVAAGVLSDVKLASTIAAIASGTKVNAVAVTGTGNFATFTVVNGVITAIVLSAS